ncbi:MAG: hypothetical protein AAFU85_24755 [Planctomycetota bacterium]
MIAFSRDSIEGSQEIKSPEKSEASSQADRSPLLIPFVTSRASARRTSSLGESADVAKAQQELAMVQRALIRCGLVGNHELKRD